MHCKKFVYVQFTQYGLHHYPKAPANVAFLATPHGHTFHFKLTFSVADANREIEFFTIKDEVIKYLEKAYKSKSVNHSLQHILDFQDKSCEMLAQELLINFKQCVEVEVSEDGIDGAIVRI